MVQSFSFNVMFIYGMVTKQKILPVSGKDLCGESRIRTCEGFPTDLQSVLVGRLSISPKINQSFSLIAVANIELFFK